MKAKTTRHTNVFEPFDLTITIETINEARILWHRLNLSHERVARSAHVDVKYGRVLPDCPSSSVIVALSELDEFMENHGMKGE